MRARSISPARSKSRSPRPRAGALLDEIERLLDNASAAKSRYVRLADRVSRLYAPVVHVAALPTALGWLAAGATLHDAMVVAISVLIVTCPCAVALAVPAVQVVTARRAVPAGVLPRRGDAIERLAEIDTIVFDKTGTLTLPSPASSMRAEVPADLLAKAAHACAVEPSSARALARQRGRALAPFDSARRRARAWRRANVDGREARLGRLAFCGVEAEPTCAMASASLHRLPTWRADGGVPYSSEPQTGCSARYRAVDESRLCNGDPLGRRRAPVLEVARALGLDRARGGLKPADKVERLKAPARRRPQNLAGRRRPQRRTGARRGACVAVARHRGGSRAKRGRRHIPWRSAGAGRRSDRHRARRASAHDAEPDPRGGLQHGGDVPLAIASVVTPLIAAVAMSGSSLLVTLNALRPWPAPFEAPTQAPARSALPGLAFRERLER